MADDHKEPSHETRPFEHYDSGKRSGYSPAKVVSLNEVPAPSDSFAPGVPASAPTSVSAAPVEGAE